MLESGSVIKVTAGSDSNRQKGRTLRCGGRVFPKVSFIVPALNEESTIEATVTTVTRAAQGRLSDYEILLINDGSSDGTASIINALADKNPMIRVFHNSKNLGLGRSYRRGVHQARFDHLMWIPSDNAVPIESLIHILSRIGEADLVLTYLQNTEDRLVYRYLLSRLFTELVNLLFGRRIRYYNGLVVHRTALIRSIPMTSDGHAYQAEAIVKLLQRGYSYVEVPYVNRWKKKESSSALRVGNIISVLGTLLRLLRRP